MCDQGARDADDRARRAVERNVRDACKTNLLTRDHVGCAYRFLPDMTGYDSSTARDLDQTRELMSSNPSETQEQPTSSYHSEDSVGNML